MSIEDKENIKNASRSGLIDERHGTQTQAGQFQAPFQLPENWNVGISKEFKRYYYFNNTDKSVSWTPPVKAWACSFGLPFGWEIGINEECTPYFICHVTETTTYRHPKLDTGEVEVLHEALQSKRRRIAIKRDQVNGFGFVAGSEKPVLIRSVMPGSPSEGLLSANDQIFSINGQVAYNLPQPQVISMIRSCTDVLELDVIASEDIQDVKNQGKLKSALMSRATRERRKSCPVNVRFDDKPEVVDITPYNVLNVNMIKQMLPNVLKVFLENGQTKSFQYAPETTVRDIFESLVEKLQLKTKDLFCLVLIGPYPNQISYLHTEDKISQVLSRKHFSRWECRLQISFAPRVAYDLLQSDPFAFDYLYEQTKNSVINGHFGAELKYDVALRLAALQMNEEISRMGGDEERKMTLKEIQKEHGGLEKFLPRGIMYSTRKKDLKKSLTYHLKLCERLTAPGQKHINSIQAKLHYLKIASEAPTFGGKSFSSVVIQEGETMTSFKEKHRDHSTVSLSAVQGICVAVPGTSMATTQLADFSEVMGMVITTPVTGKDHLKLFLRERKPISFMMEPQDVEDMVFLIHGYRKTLADETTQSLKFLNFSQSLPRLQYGEEDNAEAPGYASTHRVLPSSWSYPEEDLNELWSLSSLQAGERLVDDIAIPVKFVNTVPEIADAKSVEVELPKAVRRRTASDFGLPDGDSNSKRFRILDKYGSLDRGGSLPNRPHPRSTKALSLPDVTNLPPVLNSDEITEVDSAPLESAIGTPLAVSSPFQSQDSSIQRFVVETEDDNVDEPMFRGTRLFSGGNSDFRRPSSFHDSTGEKVVLSSFLPESKDVENRIKNDGGKIESNDGVDQEMIEADVAQNCIDTDGIRVELVSKKLIPRPNSPQRRGAVKLSETKWTTQDGISKSSEEMDVPSTPDEAAVDVTNDKAAMTAVYNVSHRPQSELQIEPEDPFQNVDPFKNLGPTQQISIDMHSFDNIGIKTKVWESGSDESQSPQHSHRAKEDTADLVEIHAQFDSPRDDYVENGDDDDVARETNETPFEVYLSNSALRTSSNASPSSEDERNVFNDPAANSLPRGVKGSVLKALCENEILYENEESEGTPNANSHSKVFGFSDSDRASSPRTDSGMEDMYLDESVVDSEIITPPHLTANSERVQSPEFFVLPPPPQDFSVDRISPTTFIVPPPPQIFDDEAEEAIPTGPRRKFSNLYAVDDLDLIRKRKAPPPPPTRAQSLKSGRQLPGSTTQPCFKSRKAPLPPSNFVSKFVDISVVEESVNNEVETKPEDVGVQHDVSERVDYGMAEDTKITPNLAENDFSRLVYNKNSTVDFDFEILEEDSVDLVNDDDHNADTEAMVENESEELEEYILDGDGALDFEFESAEEVEDILNRRTVALNKEKEIREFHGTDEATLKRVEPTAVYLKGDEVMTDCTQPISTYPVVGTKTDVMNDRRINSDFRVISSTNDSISTSTAGRFDLQVSDARVQDKEVDKDKGSSSFSSYRDFLGPVTTTALTSEYAVSTSLGDMENFKEQKAFDVDTIRSIDNTKSDYLLSDGRTSPSHDNVRLPENATHFRSRNSSMKYSFLFDTEPISTTEHTDFQTKPINQKTVPSEQSKLVKPPGHPHFSASYNTHDFKSLSTFDSILPKESADSSPQPEVNNNTFSNPQRKVDPDTSWERADVKTLRNELSLSLNTEFESDVYTTRSKEMDNTTEPRRREAGTRNSFSNPIATLPLKQNAAPLSEIIKKYDDSHLSNALSPADYCPVALSDETMLEEAFVDDGNADIVVSKPECNGRNSMKSPRKLSELEILGIDDTEATFFFGPDEKKKEEDKAKDESTPAQENLIDKDRVEMSNDTMEEETSHMPHPLHAAEELSPESEGESALVTFRQERNVNPVKQHDLVGQHNHINEFGSWQSLEKELRQQVSLDQLSSADSDKSPKLFNSRAEETVLRFPNTMDGKSNVEMQNTEMDNVSKNYRKLYISEDETDTTESGMQENTFSPYFQNSDGLRTERSVLSNDGGELVMCTNDAQGVRGKDVESLIKGDVDEPLLNENSEIREFQRSDSMSSTSAGSRTRTISTGSEGIRAELDTMSGEITLLFDYSVLDGSVPAEETKNSIDVHPSHPIKNVQSTFPMDMNQFGRLRQADDSEALKDVTVNDLSETESETSRRVCQQMPEGAGGKTVPSRYYPLGAIPFHTGGEIRRKRFSLSSASSQGSDASEREIEGKKTEVSEPSAGVPFEETNRPYINLPYSDVRPPKDGEMAALKWASRESEPRLGPVAPRHLGVSAYTETSRHSNQPPGNLGTGHADFSQGHSEGRHSPSVMAKRMGSFRSFFFEGQKETSEDVRHSRSSSLPVNGPIPFRSRAAPGHVTFQPKLSSLLRVHADRMDDHQQVVQPLTLPTLPAEKSKEYDLSITDRLSEPTATVDYTDSADVDANSRQSFSVELHNNEPKLPKFNAKRYKQNEAYHSDVTREFRRRSVTEEKNYSTKKPEETLGNYPALSDAQVSSRYSHIVSEESKENPSALRGALVATDYSHINGIERSSSKYRDKTYKSKAASFPRESKIRVSSANVVMVKKSDFGDSTSATSTDRDSSDFDRSFVGRRNSDMSPQLIEKVPVNTSYTSTAKVQTSHGVTKRGCCRDSCETARQKAMSLKWQLLDELKQQKADSIGRVDKTALLDSMRAWARSFSKCTRNFVPYVGEADETQLSDLIHSSLDRLNNLVISTIMFYKSAIGNATTEETDKGEIGQNILREVVKSVLVVVDEYGSVVECVQSAFGKSVNDASVVNLIEQADQLGFAVTVVIRTIRSAAADLGQHSTTIT